MAAFTAKPADNPSAIPAWVTGCANPRLTLVNWEHRTLPALETDTPISVSTDLLRRQATITLATRSTCDSLRRLMKTANRSLPLPPVEPCRNDEGFLRVRAEGPADAQLMTARAMAALRPVDDTVATALTESPVAASFGYRTIGGIPTGLLVLLAFGGFGGLWLLRRELRS